MWAGLEGFPFPELCQHHLPSLFLHARSALHLVYQDLRQ